MRQRRLYAVVLRKFEILLLVNHLDTYHYRVNFHALAPLHLQFELLQAFSDVKLMASQIPGKEMLIEHQLLQFAHHFRLKYSADERLQLLTLLVIKTSEEAEKELSQRVTYLIYIDYNICGIFN